MMMFGQEKEFFYTDPYRFLCDVALRAGSNEDVVLPAESPQTLELGFCVGAFYYRIPARCVYQSDVKLIFITPQKRRHLAAWFTRTRGKEPITCSEHWTEEDSKCLERILQRSV